MVFYKIYNLKKSIYENINKIYYRHILIYLNFCGDGRIRIRVKN
jgi:hypothetical protein